MNTQLPVLISKAFCRWPVVVASVFTMLLACQPAAADTIVYDVSFSQSGFDDMNHKEGYEYLGSDWDNDAYIADVNLRYSVNTVTATFNLISADFSILHNGISKYSGTVNVGKTNDGASGYEQMYVSGNFMVIDIYDLDGGYNDGVAFTGDEVNNVDGNGGALSQSASSMAGGPNDRRFQFYAELDSSTWAAHNYDFVSAGEAGDIDVTRLYVGWEGWRDLQNRSPNSPEDDPAMAGVRGNYLTEASGKFPTGVANIIPEPATFGILTACLTALCARRRRVV